MKKLITLCFTLLIVGSALSQVILFGRKPAAAAAPPPSPSLWIVSTNVSPIAANGGNVTNITDISGNGHTFSFYNATPSYFTNGQNSLPYIAFGTGTYLTNATLPTSLSGADTPFTAIIVAQKGTPDGTMFQVGSTASANQGNAISGEFGSWRVWRRDDANTMADVNTGTYNTGVWVFSVVFSGTSVSLYTNSTAVFSAQSQNVGTLTLNTAVIGGRSLGGTFSSVWDGGKIYEIKLWAGTALSDTDRGTEETALRSKYGL